MIYKYNSAVHFIMEVYTQYEISRRDKQFYKKQFEKEWTEHYWNEFILKCEDKIDWLQLSSNSNITWDIVTANPDKSWNLRVLSRNSNITWDIIEANPDKPWSWYYLSKNLNINRENLVANPDKPWDWWQISFNPNITYEFIEAYPDKPWDWYELSCNPNITWEIIKDNPDKPWNWFEIFNNLFIKDKECFMERKHREHMAAFRIQTRWRRAYEDPTYTLCKKQLSDKFDALFGE